MSIRATIAIGLLTLTLSACSSADSSNGNPLFGVSASASVPQPITRVELMSRYAELAPLDRSATPETMDGLADSACRKLREGVSTDRLITAGTDIFKAKATEIMTLLVSYRCPEFLKDFK